jgi:preprotein translocase subunit SecG
MYTLLLTLLILDAILLSAVVLLQAGQGGGLATMGGGGTESVLGGRQAVTILTKLSWWCGGIFLALSLILSVMQRGSTGASDLQQRLRQSAPPAAQAPTGPSPLQGLTPAPGAPAATPGSAAPSATAPTTTPAPAPAAPAPKK